METQGQTATFWTPSKKQVEFIKAMLEGEKPLSVKQAAEQAGVARQTPYKWFNHDGFMVHFKERRELMAKVWGGVADRSLITQVLKGNVPAIKLFYERFDGLKDTIEVNHKGNVRHEHNHYDYSEYTSEQLREEAHKVALKLEVIANGANGSSGNGSGSKSSNNGDRPSNSTPGTP